MSVQSQLLFLLSRFKNILHLGVAEVGPRRVVPDPASVANLGRGGQGLVLQGDSVATPDHQRHAAAGLPQV